MTSTAFGHHGLHELAKHWRWLCHYCRRATTCPVCNPESDRTLAATRDHWIPRSRGGSDGWGNLVLACRSCNDAKGNRLPDGPIPIWATPVAGYGLRAHDEGRPPVSRPVVKAPRVAPKQYRACRDGWHKTEAQADAAIAALFTATGRRFESYQCAFCQRWHVERALEQESA